VQLLATLADALGDRPVSILRVLRGPVALTYAATHQEANPPTVSLWLYAKGADIATSGYEDALDNLVKVHWGLVP